MHFTFDRTVPALRFEQEDPAGESFHVFVARQAYAMTAQGLMPLADQPPLLDADMCFGERLASSVQAESELAPYKPRCDVIVNAAAHAPRGKPARRVVTTLRVERADGTRVIDKSLLVTGECRWQRSSLPVRLGLALLTVASLGLIRPAPWRLTRPAPFLALPVRYESAYGGECRIDALPENRERLRRRIGAKFCLTDEQLRAHPDADSPTGPPLAHTACEDNPIGRGYCRAWYLRATGLDRLPAPSIAYADAPITASLLWQAMHERAAPLTAGYGFVGRAWLPRRQLIGEIVMDCAPDDEACPRLPDDFDYGYWNGAPRDQQCEYLAGGARVVLVNLCRPDHPLARAAVTGDTVLSMTLPDAQPYLALLDEHRRIGVKQLALDTVVIDPEAGWLTLTWRCVLPAAIGLQAAELRFARSDDEKADLAALLKLQRAADGVIDEELPDAA